jgi:hypothetical protein
MCDNYVKTFLCAHYGTAALTAYVCTVALSGEVNKSKDAGNLKKKQWPHHSAGFLVHVQPVWLGG